MEENYTNINDYNQYSVQAGGQTSAAPAAGGGSEDRSKLLAGLFTAIASTTDAQAACEAVINDAAYLVGADCGSVFLSTDGYYLKYVAGFGLPHDFAALVEETARSAASPHYLTGSMEPFVVRDVNDAPEPADYASALRSAHIMALASFPLLTRGRLLGYMTVYHEEPYSFTTDELDTLHVMSAGLAMSVANVQLTEAKQGEDRARDRFLSALSHELRTPLTSIMGFTQVIRKRLQSNTGVDPRLSDQLEVLWTQAQRLNRLIDTFVDLSNIERGDFEINLGKVDLGTLLRSAVQQAVAQAHSNQVVQTDLPSQPVWVHGDGKRLEQVFSHVISNALRYSPQGKSVTVRCRLESSGSKARIEVIDLGPGIPAHLRKEIFERTLPGEAQRSGGLGVGLYLTKMVVEAHGGHIGIQSSPNDGTTISIELPL